MSTAEFALDIEEITGLYGDSVIDEERYLGLDDYQGIASKFALYPDHGQQTPLSITYGGLACPEEAGEIAGNIKKAIRDEDFFHSDNGLKDSRREKIKKEAGDLLWELSQFCHEMGWTLSHLAMDNLNKLHDRKMQNTIQGDGSAR